MVKDIISSLNGCTCSEIATLHNALDGFSEGNPLKDYLDEEHILKYLKTLASVYKSVELNM